MGRNFDQIRDDARAWLYASTRPKPSIRNEVGNFGFLRRATTLLTDPIEVAFVAEHTTLQRKKFGAIILQASDENLPSIIFRWTDGEYSVMSELTYRPSEPVRLTQLSGVVLDAVHDRLAPAVNAINLQRITEGF